MAFHPYPQLIPPVFNLGGFGPPHALTRASTWPWVDHPASGPRRATGRPIRTRCRYGSPTRVNLATRRRLAGSFFNRHAITPRPPDTRPEDAHKEALTARERPVSGTVSLPSRGTFHHSLTVLVRYRSSGGIQAAEWSRQIHTGFHGPRATGGRARAARRVPPTGLSPAAAPRPRGFGYPTGSMHCAPPRRRREERAPTTPRAQPPPGDRTRTV